MTEQPALVVRASAIHGSGVFATASFRRGDVLLALDDSRIVDAARPLRPECGEQKTHCDYLPDGTVVLMQRPERYVNHSCHPNAYVYSANRRRFLLALREIEPGAEIVVDYALNAFEGDEWECRCGARGCRGRHTCDFFALPASVQRALLPYLDPWFAAVHASRIQSLLARAAQ